MSAEELKFIFTNGSIVRCEFMDENTFVFMADGQATILDRNQAHLLMSYLQEHLK